MKSLTFSLNSYDRDGEEYERGIYLHFDETRVRIGTMKDFERFIEELKKIEREIKDNYSEDRIP